MADYYTFLDAQQITEFVPPSSSKQVIQVRGTEPHSGIVFLSIMSRKEYYDDTYRIDHMNRLGHALYLESQTPNVTGLSVRQIQDSQNQLRNVLDVTVESDSGNSDAIIQSPYPKPNFIQDSVDAFAALVQAEVDKLNAAEAS